METVQQNGRFTLFSSKFLSMYSILYVSDLLNVHTDSYILHRQTYMPVPKNIPTHKDNYQKYTLRIFNIYIS